MPKVSSGQFFRPPYCTPCDRRRQNHSPKNVAPEPARHSAGTATRCTLRAVATRNQGDVLSHASLARHSEQATVTARSCHKQPQLLGNCWATAELGWATARQDRAGLCSVRWSALVYRYLYRYLIRMEIRIVPKIDTTPDNQ